MSDPTQAAHDTEGKFVEMPRPTAWPFAMAIGTALTFSGLLTNASLSVLGAILTLCGAVGWFRQVLPHEQHELVPVRPEEAAVPLPKRPVKRLVPAAQIQRAWLPVRTYPLVAGIKGGLAGGVVMAVLAMVYGIAMYHSVWYPVNLLAGSLYTPSTTPSVEAMMHFRLDWFLFAAAMHITMCLLVGLLYGAMLPLLPTRPILLGGLIGPLLWTGLLYHVIGFVNPLLDSRINWWWFAVSQVGFGVVAGFVVAHQNKVLTAENMPLALRAGIEAPGLLPERDEDHR